MSLVAFAAWIAGVAFSFYNGNRKLPLAILLLGIGVLFVPYGSIRIAGIALLAAIIWIANKLDM